MANVQRGTSLCEVDFSAIEAVLVGWFARDPDYVRLAKLGVHSGLASHLLKKPFDTSWLLTRTKELREYLLAVKAEAKKTPSGDSNIYEVAKRISHGTNYCLTPHGMHNNFPKEFTTVGVAQKYQRIYFQMAPTIPAWQKSVQKFAYDHGFLGGPGDPPFGHPFAYKHWFWAVASYKKISDAQAERRTKNGNPVAYFHGQPYAVELGEDAKRAVAFYPQSTGRGLLTEAMLRLFDPVEAEPYNSYIGDAYYGRTPLRAPIHDSLFLEFPRRIQDRALEIVIREMTRPCVQLPNPESWGLGEYLVVDVEAKVGQAWSAMETVEGFSVGESAPYEAALASDDEDVEALQVSVA